MRRFDVVVIGAGFAGTILARIVHQLGRKVALLERESHPRFALGESATPLGAICLERLAARYGLEDLRHLAAYGRWLESMPGVRRGLKRGFTFYQHRPGRAFDSGPGNDRRLLVAASPDDEVADSHWLRQDVDHFLVDRAISEGVDYRDCCEVEEVERLDQGWRLRGHRSQIRFEIETDLLVDGSGSSAFLAKHLGLESALGAESLDTSLVFAHFERVGDFRLAAARLGAEMSEGPYPDEKAAVHHLLEEGWMYVLPFDHGVVSAGILVSRDHLDLGHEGRRSAGEIWHSILSRYPTLAAQFAAATPLNGIRYLSRVPRCLDKAAGRDWALLPHSFAFFDPMFSTGMAWSLLAVERLAMICQQGSGLQRYGDLLSAEAKQIGRLIEGAWEASSDFDLFVHHSFLYFGLVSFEEVRQRLQITPGDTEQAAWCGFLAAEDPVWVDVFRQARARLAAIQEAAAGRQTSDLRDEFCDWISEAISSRNIAGLADPKRHNLYPVDLEVLIERSELLGLTAEELRPLLPRLRGLGASAHPTSTGSSSR